MNYKKQYINLLRNYKWVSIFYFVYATFAFLLILAIMDREMGIFLLIAVYILHVKERIRVYLRIRKEIQESEGCKI